MEIERIDRDCRQTGAVYKRKVSDAGDVGTNRDAALKLDT